VRELDDGYAFVGLIGAIGADLDEVSREISEALTGYGYKSEEIRATNLISSLPMFDSNRFNKAKEADRIREFMDAGDMLRREYGDDIIARLCVADIRAKRTGSEKKVFIVRSFKTPEEIKLFRDVYKKNSWIISVFASRHQRLENLTRKIAASESLFPSDDFRKMAAELIDRDKDGRLAQLDDGTISGSSGQNVADAFPLADVFFDSTKDKNLKAQSGRFVHLLFGKPFITPTRDEQSMFFAWASSLRSADLSRQVGALISDNDGMVISSGCNEVPRAGGGSYWSDDPEGEDNRDYKRGSDPSVEMKHRVVSEFISSLKSAGVISEAHSNVTDDELARDLINGTSGGNSPLKGTLVANLLEFGRVVHAEMAALSQAAQSGRSVQDATLYCTTFPCHNCARHIISSGIDRVVFIEPYEKSQVVPLYKDEISLISGGDGGRCVRFTPFYGVAPRRYNYAFRMRARKSKTGHVVEWPPASPKPQGDRFTTYSTAERDALSSKQLKDLLGKRAEDLAT
jgi:cytidine deaminase